MKMYDVYIGQHMTAGGTGGFVTEATEEHMKPEHGNGKYIFMCKNGTKCVIKLDYGRQIAMGYFDEFAKRMKEITIEIEERE
jgi:hypothetical protein